MQGWRQITWDGRGACTYGSVFVFEPVECHTSQISVWKVNAPAIKGLANRVLLPWCFPEGSIGSGIGINEGKFFSNNILFLIAALDLFYEAMVLRDQHSGCWF